MNAANANCCEGFDQVFDVCCNDCREVCHGCKCLLNSLSQLLIIVVEQFVATLIIVGQFVATFGKVFDFCTNYFPDVSPLQLLPNLLFLLRLLQTF